VKEIALFLRTSEEFKTLPSAILKLTPLVHSNHSTLDKSFVVLK
jgi:hypothetical protein